MDKEGRVHTIDKSTPTITGRAGNAERKVVYDENTKFTVLNNPGKLEDVKEGGRVICVGTFDDQARLAATRIDARMN